MQKRTLRGVVISKAAGFLVFLILLAIASYLRSSITNSFYNSIVDFLIVNLHLSFVIFFITLLADVFWVLKFPLNLPAPILSAVGSVYVVMYIYRFWIFLNSYIKTSLIIPIYPLYFLVFWIVVLVGYILVIARRGKSRRELEEEHEEVMERRKVKIGRQFSKIEKKTKEVGWDEIGNNFKFVLYNLGDSLNRLFSKKENLKKKRKR